MEWVASTLHASSEHGVSSITTADAHTSAASSRLTWCTRRFKWTGPFRRKTKSAFYACPITFQMQSNVHFHSMQAYRKVKVLTYELYGREWSASRPGHFTHSERGPPPLSSTHWRGDLVVLGVGPDGLEKTEKQKKVPCLKPNYNFSWRPARSHYIDWANST